MGVMGRGGRAWESAGGVQREGGLNTATSLPCQPNLFSVYFNLVAASLGDDPLAKLNFHVFIFDGLDEIVKS